MEMIRLITATIFTFVLAVVPPSAAAGAGSEDDLLVGFYDKTCPNVERIVADVVAKAVEADQKLPSALIRLYFHDCFVKGCDASILLDATPSHEPVEMESPANGGVRGIELIEEIKAKLEAECPLTVSCADILAFVAREAVALSGLPRHGVPAGRRDSLTSRASDVTLPNPATPIDDMIAYFETRGMNSEEMVVLFGAHSMGAAHCTLFDYRLYNFNKTQKQDPSMNPVYAAELSEQCPAPNTLPKEEAKSRVVDFDPTTPLVLDSKYYLNVIRGRGLLQSDQALTSDPRTIKLVMKMAVNGESWARRFVQTMIKLGRTNVLTNEAGEIRKACRTYN